jgi:hypothetical protein
MNNKKFIEAAMKSMSKEDIERYAKQGEAVFGNTDFEESKIIDASNFEIPESAAYIIEQIKSGLHPSYLSAPEKQVMTKFYGKKWYLKYGYRLRDLTEIS